MKQENGRLLRYSLIRAPRVFAPTGFVVTIVVIRLGNIRSANTAQGVVPWRKLRHRLADGHRSNGAVLRTAAVVVVDQVRLPEVCPVFFGCQKRLARDLVHPKLLVLVCEPRRVHPLCQVRYPNDKRDQAEQAKNDSGPRWDPVTHPVILRWAVRRGKRGAVAAVAPAVAVAPIAAVACADRRLCRLDCRGGGGGLGVARGRTPHASPGGFARLLFNPVARAPDRLLSEPCRGCRGCRGVLGARVDGVTIVVGAPPSAALVIVEAFVFEVVANVLVQQPSITMSHRNVGTSVYMRQLATEPGGEDTDEVLLTPLLRGSAHPINVVEVTQKKNRSG